MQRILTAAQFREVDRHAIVHEPISSIDLMERAAKACVHWIRSNVLPGIQFRIFCGPGNNGGDGAAIARLLASSGYEVVCYSFGDIKKWSEDRRINDDRLLAAQQVLSEHIHDLDHLPSTGHGEVWIDALFGTGLTRPLEDSYAEIVIRMNQSGARLIAIDLPSGLMADDVPQPDSIIVKADETLTFHAPKLTFFLTESGPFVGQWHVLDIGLDHAFTSTLTTDYLVPDWSDFAARFLPRKRFTHKGTYGHGLLVAGSRGKYGAAILSARGALRSGIGLLSIQAPRSAEIIIQSSVPEAMYVADSGSDSLAGPVTDLSGYKAVGIGPGCGTDPATVRFIRTLINDCTLPMVVDADGINALAGTFSSSDGIPSGTILTPHPKEFERITRPVKNDLERLKLLQLFARTHQVIVVLKGAYTRIALPDGKILFNTTGNAGLARGGSGDLLTGIILAFLAQGYNQEDAAMLGVFVHGAAADKVATRTSMQSLSLDEVIHALPEVFSGLEK
ncbi:MAG: NAD(P)H-hydrate dehydratase [Bacteroidota bacterium]